MSKTVYIKGTSIGEDADYFIIYHTAIDFTNQVGNPVYRRNELIAGVTISDVPDAANLFYIAANSGYCTTTGSATIPPSPTPTTTPVIPVTPSPSVVYLNAAQFIGPLSLSEVCVRETPALWLYYSGPVSDPVIEMKYWANPTGTVNPAPGYYRIVSTMPGVDNYMKLTSTGNVIYIETCSTLE